MTPTATAEPDATATKVTEPRDYLVFAVRNHEGHAESWEDVGFISAHNRDEALELIVGALPKDEQDGLFVAIAARHWKPVRPTIEVTTKRTWGA